MGEDRELEDYICKYFIRGGKGLRGISSPVLKHLFYRMKKALKGREAGGKSFEVVERWMEMKEDICRRCLGGRIWTVKRKRGKRIRDPIYGDMDFSFDEVFLIDSCYLQRLREISQMGFLFMVFPSARHSRFEHSLGVAYNAKRLFNELRRKGDLYEFFKFLFEKKVNSSGVSELIKEYKNDIAECVIKGLIVIEEKVLVYAALLHDIGHLPFSHSSEAFFERSYKDFFKKTYGEMIFKGGMNEEQLLSNLARVLSSNGKALSDLINLCDLKKFIKLLLYIFNKPHEVDSYSLIKQRNFHLEFEKRHEKFRNCLYLSLSALYDYLLDKNIREPIQRVLESKGVEKEEIEKVIERIKDLFGIRREQLILKTARYVLSSKFESILIMICDDFLYRGRKDINEMKEEIRKAAEEYVFSNPLHEVINSDWLDVDKLDYLIRDSYFSGFEFIIKFVDKILGSIRLKRYNKEDNSIENKKGVKVERYVLSIDARALPELLNLIHNKIYISKYIHVYPLNSELNRAFEQILETYFQEKFDKVMKEKSKSDDKHELDYMAAKLNKLDNFYKSIRKQNDCELLEGLKDYLLRKYISCDYSEKENFLKVFSLVSRPTMRLLLAVSARNDSCKRKIEGAIKKCFLNNDIIDVITYKEEVDISKKEFSQIKVFLEKEDRAYCLKQFLEKTGMAYMYALRQSIIYIFSRPDIFLDEKALKDLKDFARSIESLNDCIILVNKLRDLKNRVST